MLFEWIPLNEQGLTVTGVTWPAAIAFDRDDSHDVTLITHEQGVMIPNTWLTAVSTKDITFDGRFETAGGYMPWFAQLRADGHGYIAICETHGMPVTASTIPAMARYPYQYLAFSQASAQ